MKITKNSAKRALRTFVQAAVAYFTVNIALINFDSEKSAIKSALIGLAVSTLAAGLAAVMNLEGKEDNSHDNGQLG